MLKNGLIFLFVFRQRGGQFKSIAESYYGLVIENFECEQSIYTAVEVCKIHFRLLFNT